MRRRLYAWTESVNAQTNALNPEFNAALFHDLYQAVEVSHYVPTQADAATRAKLLDWRKQMNGVLK